MSKQAIIFGGSGFLGSHVADSLSAGGHKVTIFDRKESLYLRSDQAMVVGDILDVNQVRKAMKDQDIVYHFAGLADLDYMSDKALEAVNQNIVGTIHLLDAAVEFKVGRFVFASTIYVYSGLGGFYRCSKQACELYIEEYQKLYDLDFTILRYGSLYGPRAGISNSIRRYLKEGLENQRINYPGTGDEVREYIHVKDAAKLSFDILVKEYKNRHIIITGHNPMKAGEMLAMVQEILCQKVSIDYAGNTNESHYNITPYSFIPKVGSKLVSNLYMDMGQGFLECLQEISQDAEKRKTSSTNE
jgi:UDP-glucose 4-epimerase